jgi:hypothetical protein
MFGAPMGATGPGKDGRYTGRYVVLWCGFAALIITVLLAVLGVTT